MVQHMYSVVFWCSNLMISSPPKNNLKYLLWGQPKPLMYVSECVCHQGHGGGCECVFLCARAPVCLCGCESIPNLSERTIFSRAILNAVLGDAGVTDAEPVGNFAKVPDSREKRYVFPLKWIWEAYRSCATCSNALYRKASQSMPFSHLCHVASSFKLFTSRGATVQNGFST